MKLDEQILDRLREMVKAPYLVFPAEVKEVDRSTLSCTILPQDGVEMFDVRLKAGVENVTEGLVEIPAINSSVLVVLIGNSPENAFVAKCSRVEEVLFYGGENGGLIKVSELVSQLEKVNSYLKTLTNAFMAPVPVVSGDGGTALAGHISSQLASEQIPDYSKIENPKVKH
ncbi:MAG: hypothetical protein HEP71_00630 [Roseivirga sp.]|nr:hypothetical protein [Roseivirga sp.]